MSNSVALCFDENYYSAACVVLTSLFINSTSDYDIDLITNAENLDLTPLNRLINIYKRNIYLHHVNNDFSDYKVSGHITKATYLRFLIPEHTKSENIVYLDCDVIVQSDISDIFKAIEKNKNHIFGVRDITGTPLAKEKLGIIDSYFNAGVLGFSSSNWRDSNLSEKLIEYSIANNSKITWHDQCIINGALEGQKEELDSKFNVLMQDIELGHVFIDDFNIHDFNGIFHYNSTTKPWHLWCNRKYRELWEKYASISPAKPQLISHPRNLTEMYNLATYHKNNNEFEKSTEQLMKILKLINIT